MKHLQFAIASIVDANTGFGLDHGGGKIDYVAAERQGRTIRAKSIIALFESGKQRIAAAVKAYRARAQERRALNELLKLSDRNLRDIGLSRGDLSAVQYSTVTLAQLNAERRGSRQEDVAQVATAAQVEHSQEAVNQEIYAEAKCA